MKIKLLFLVFLLASGQALAQLDVPQASGGPLGSGSWLRFTTGGDLTSIQEYYGLNLSGSNVQPVKVINTSLLVGYTNAGQGFGVGNAYINGSLGVGTTNSQGKLTIVGPLDGSLSSLNIGDGSPGNTNVAVGASTGGYNIDFNTWRDIVPNQIGARIRAERINSYNPNSALIQSMDLAFYTSNGVDQSYLTEKLRIKSDGSVGIGTTNTYGYKLAVNGTAIATSVVVKSYGTWPDYVFKNDYPLMPLNTVRDYIDQNHHLPNIPSAEEVEKDGQNLGEMNKLLLKKVEELTLYLIEKDEQLKKDELILKQLAQGNEDAKTDKELIRKLSQRLDLLESKAKNK